MKRNSLMQERPKAVGPATGVVLEVGFGSGLNLPFYTNIIKVYALDVSPELMSMAKVAVKQAPFPVEYLIASAEKIPLPNESVNTVVSTWTLCSIPDIKKALRECRRVLKPGGHLLFMDHGLSSQGFLKVLQHVITPLSKPFTGGCHLNRPIDILIGEAGFKIVELEKYPQKFSPLNFVYRGIAIKN